MIKLDIEEGIMFEIQQTLWNTSSAL